MPRISSIEFVGKKQTFDLEVEHKNHQYYTSNGILQSNSHAVAYAIDSYYAAWLHTYHEKEWLATILQSENGNPKGITKAISEIKSYGYKISKVDINHSGLEWEFSYELDAFVPPLTSLKGVGDKAVEEIFENRPYKCINDLFYDEENKWKHSKLNKTAFDSLCKMEALSSIEEFKTGKVKNHRQLHEIIINNYATLKKGKWGITKTQYNKLIKNNENPQEIFNKLLNENSDVNDWNRIEKIDHQISLSNDVSLDLLFPENLIKRINEKNINSFNDIKSGEKDIGWFCIVDIIRKETKNGKTFSRIKVSDYESNSAWIRVWGELCDSEKYTIWISELNHDPNWGYQTSLTKMKKLKLFR